MQARSLGARRSTRSTRNPFSSTATSCLPTDARERPAPNPQRTRFSCANYPNTARAASSFRPAARGSPRARRRHVCAASGPERLRPSGLELEGRATIEVSADGQPRACLVRLATVPAESPQGFATIPARQGVAQLVGSFEELNAARLASVRAGVPPGRLAGPAYVRFPIDADPPPQVLIIVPLAAKD